MRLHEATAILRGKAGVTTPKDRERATAVVLHHLDDVFGVRVWASRLLAALDEQDQNAIERARRRLEDALTRARSEA